MRGPLFENFVVMEALKHRFNAGRESNLFFYRDSNRNEIDLLLLTQQKIDGYKIKSSSTFHPDFTTKLSKMGEYVSGNIGHRAVIYNGTLENEHSQVQLHHWRNYLP